MKLHQVPQYLLNPNHPITITLIGCGGNGSLMLSRLARLDFAMQQLGKVPLNIKVYDDDIVEASNIGRQMFGIPDVGEFKSITTVSKINRNFGFNYKAIPRKFDVSAQLEDEQSNIYITCVDSAKFRVEFDKEFKKIKTTNYGHCNTYYWIDLGNGKKHGQVVIGSNKIEQPKSKEYSFIDTLPTILDRFPNIIEQDTEEIQGRGCSYKAKLEEQSLFINDVLASNAIDLLKEILVDGLINTIGVFTNLEKHRTNPITL